MKKIVFTRPDGGISIIHPTGEISLEEVMAKDVPSDAINPQIIEEGDIPIDKKNREAWIFSNGKIIIDQNKVKEKLDELNLKETKKQNILNKIKISSDDLDILKEIING